MANLHPLLLHCDAPVLCSQSSMSILKGKQSCTRRIGTGIYPTSGHICPDVVGSILFLLVHGEGHIIMGCSKVHAPRDLSTCSACSWCLGGNAITLEGCCVLVVASSADASHV
eukprot:scaffold12969_cov65-Attheya_sp.AAC.10